MGEKNTSLKVNIRRIPLTRGYEAIVDEDDYEQLSKNKWYAASRLRQIYATRHLDRNQISLMHREILGKIPEGYVVDHINRNGLDNRKKNLRICTVSENLLNRPKYRGHSQYKGVSWHKKSQRWRATFRGKDIGWFLNEKEAAKCYDEAVSEYSEIGYQNGITDA